MMKTFDDVKFRFETLSSQFKKTGFDLEKLVLEPPVSEKALQAHEKKWKRKLPEEMRRFFLECAGKVYLEWYDPICFETEHKQSICKKPHKFKFPCEWPFSCGADWSLDSMDLIYEKVWSGCEEAFNDGEYYDPLSPYDYSYSYPVIMGGGGELFILYAPPSGERLVFHYGDTFLKLWHKAADSFEEFWENWSLVGCPHFGGYECFYNKKKQIIDAHCADAITWRKFLGIENLETE